MINGQFIYTSLLIEKSAVGRFFFKLILSISAISENEKFNRLCHLFYLDIVMRTIKKLAISARFSNKRLQLIEIKLVDDCVFLKSVEFKLQKFQNEIRIVRECASSIFLLAKR